MMSGSGNSAAVWGKGVVRKADEQLSLEIPSLGEPQVRFRQGPGQHIFNRWLFQVLRHGEFADKQIPGSFQHLLFPKGKRLGLVQHEKAFQDRGYFQERTGPHLFGILLEPVFPIGTVSTVSVGQKFQNFLNFPVFHNPPQPYAVDIVERHHNLEAAGLNLQKVELLDRLTKSAAADLLDNADAVIGVNDLVTYVED